MKFVLKRHLALNMLIFPPISNTTFRLWADWVIRSRVIGWWLYTNTVKGSELGKLWKIDIQSLGLNHFLLKCSTSDVLGAKYKTNK